VLEMARGCVIRNASTESSGRHSIEHVTDEFHRIIIRSGSTSKPMCEG
jgi:hypothetical protein